MTNKNLMLVVFILVAVVVAVFGWQWWNQSKLQAIVSFEDCVAAGNPVMESYPEQCRTPDGRTFVRDLADQPAPSLQPGSLTVVGEIVCLPHADTSGPQTLECAYGIEADDGTYYALRDSDPQYSNLMGLPTGERVEVNGNFTPQDDSKYQSAGVLEIMTVNRMSTPTPATE